MTLLSALGAYWNKYGTLYSVISLGQWGHSNFSFSTFGILCGGGYGGVGGLCVFFCSLSSHWTTPKEKG